jgi:hypothetical protein
MFSNPPPPRARYRRKTFQKRIPGSIHGLVPARILIGWDVSRLWMTESRTSFVLGSRSGQCANTSSGSLRAGGMGGEGGQFKRLERNNAREGMPLSMQGLIETSNNIGTARDMNETYPPLSTSI